MTAYRDWREPTRILAIRTGPATADQLRIALRLGLHFSGDEPQGVVEAIMRGHASSTRLGRRFRPATAPQLLELAGQGSPFASDLGLPRDVAAAWLRHYRSVRNLNQLLHLRLQAGDRVQYPADVGVDREPPPALCHGVVASIRDDGYVNLRGGNGRHAWGYLLEHDTASDLDVLQHD